MESPQCRELQNHKRANVAKMLMRANIGLNRENAGVFLFKRIAAMARIEH